MSCARVQTYTATKISAAEKHNERKNSDYSNINVVPERIPMNVHFKSPGDKTYMQILKDMETEGKVSRRGLRADAVLFDEIIFDVNTMYFEERGGYEYTTKFFAEAYRYACEKYGEENIISAVMHADEINKAVSDELGHPVYHYHMHLINCRSLRKRSDGVSGAKIPNWSEQSKKLYIKSAIRRSENPESRCWMITVIRSCERTESRSFDRPTASYGMNSSVI